MAASLRTRLEAEGFIVEVARDGIDGLWRATEFDFDTMVLDIILPGLNRSVAANRLRQPGRRVPILVLTATDAERASRRLTDASPSRRYGAVTL